MLTSAAGCPPGAEPDLVLRVAAGPRGSLARDAVLLVLLVKVSLDCASSLALPSCAVDLRMLGGH